jgi:hypothetical protein
VFIGQNLDVARLRDELDECLLDAAEMALGYGAWEALPDPFGPWQAD